MKMVLKHGFTPNETLLEWDLYPFGSDKWIFFVGLQIV